ncbi:MAG: polysaccharide deacetylase family protein [Blastocatellia bacterium]|nr:polysaccharide deacetylase family protein [Blastocatellia bacterium]
MRNILIVGALLVCFSAAAQPRKMAVTIDDLPFMVAGHPQYLPNAQRVTKELMRVLRAHQVPAIGFVNERQLQVTGEMDARVALLQQWLDAGLTLGNHTYSHPDLNAVSIEQYQDDIVRGDIVLRRLMHPRTPVYFRHPMTHTGETQAKKEAIDSFLALRGYKITPHTIENSDFIYNISYVRARRGNDAAMQKKLRDSYLDFTIAATEFAEKISPQIFGREIPQTLLIHANDLNADCLDELLKRYEKRGYRFITLDEAMNDPAYQTKDTNVSRNGPTWLWRWMKSKGMNVSFKDDPELPGWVMDLYRQN